jgi:hypothetical protein
VHADWMRGGSRILEGDRRAERGWAVIAALSLGAGGGEKREARLAIALSPAHAYPRMLSLKKFKGDRRKQMKTLSKMVFASVLTFVVVTGTASGQAPSAPPTTPYGAPIGLEAAKKLMAAAEAEATKNNWGWQSPFSTARVIS